MGWVQDGGVLTGIVRCVAMRRHRHVVGGWALIMCMADIVMRHATPRHTRPDVTSGLHAGPGIPAYRAAYCTLHCGLWWGILSGLEVPVLEPARSSLGATWRSVARRPVPRKSIPLRRGAGRGYDAGPGVRRRKRPDYTG